MIKSMTGYGKKGGGGYVVEMRSVNHKFLDLTIKMPRDLLPLEPRLKKAVSERFSRGRIEVYVSRDKEAAPRALKLDTDAARQYMSLLSELKNMFDLPGDIDLSMMASLKEIVSEEEVSEDLDKAWSSLDAPLTDCMDALDEMRLREGAALTEDLRERVRVIAASIDVVEGRAPVVVTEYARKLKERVARLAEGIELDRDRLHQEVAVYADRCDVTEEIVRGRSHISQLTGLLGSDGPVGRKMEFLLQEMNREVNTIGSKALDTEISHQVVEAKAELEKIREQVQNIE